MIGGTSHSGKSTLAEYIANAEDLEYLSTDKLARHPGRPWKDQVRLLPKDVQDFYEYTIEYFQNQDMGFLMNDVVSHYSQNIKPLLLAELNNRFSDKNIIVEGSAIMPSLALEDDSKDMRFLFLILNDTSIRNRILKNSSYNNRSDEIRRAIDTFILRGIEFNNLLYSQALSLNLPYIIVDENMSVDNLYNISMDKLKL